MIKIPSCSDVNFNSPFETEGYAHLLTSLFRNNNGFSLDLDSDEMKEFRNCALEWLHNVEINIDKQNARGIQLYLSWYDWIYRLAHNAPDNGNFTETWNWVAFKRMSEGENADAVHFMRWIRINPNKRSKSELSWYDGNIHDWSRGAKGLVPFQDYKIEDVYSISSFLLSAKQLLADEIKSTLQEYLIDNIDSNLNIENPEIHEAIRAFLMGTNIPFEERNHYLLQILKKLSEDVCLNSFVREAYALDYQYEC